MKYQNGLKQKMRKKTRYIVYHQERGIFVGVLSGYAIFSKNDATDTYEVYGFETLQKAKDFFEGSVPGMADQVLYEEIESETEYVSVIDLVKSGKKHLDIYELFLNLPAENELIC